MQTVAPGQRLCETRETLETLSMHMGYSVRSTSPSNWDLRGEDGDSIHSY